MPLDPSIRARLDAYAALGNPPVEQSSPAEIRARLAELVAQQQPFAGDTSSVVCSSAPGPEGDIPLRIYTPAGADPATLVVYFHGGGWISGSPASHDVFCRRLASEASVVIASVDYRLAPEHPFPAAPEDCLAATDWAFTQAQRVFVAGDSAGGNLATVVAMMRRDREDTSPSLAGQILLWPVMAYYDPPTTSYEENADGFGLTAKGMAYMWDLYLTDRSQAEFPYAAPLRAPDLSHLPPALVITAEYDILRDEGNAYAEKLHAAGVAVEHHCVPGVNHGFAVWPDTDPDLPQAVTARLTIARWLHDRE